MKIKEAIIVEGKDDITAVKAAVDAEVIATGGAMISKAKLKTIKDINDRCGIIILTDPDYAGEKIRRRLSSLCPDAKHSFISRSKAERKGDVGVENAGPEEIKDALLKAKAELVERFEPEISKADLYNAGLLGGAGSKEKREILGDILGIGYCNGKQLLNRLGSFDIGAKEFQEAVKKMEEKING